jgi:chromosome partitioning protein
MTKSLSQTHIFVIGNEKGGSGKTTTAVHLIVYLLKMGFKVASIDVDFRQASLTNYLANRMKLGDKVLQPFHQKMECKVEDKDEVMTEEFAQKLAKAVEYADFVVIDTPGSYTHLSKIAHSFADTVITPLNDSFLDLDLIAKIDGETMEIKSPSIYSQMLWEQKMERAKRDRGQINWVVLRNRLSHLDAINKRNMGEILTKLAKRIGFNLAEGFCERVIFRELFLKGLTVMDSEEYQMTISHIAARQELREFMKSLNIEAISKKLLEAQEA